MKPTDLQRQLEVVKRGSVQLVPEAELTDKLRQGRPLRVKWGADPSAPDIHLGHTVVLNKMRQLQDLGHRVIFIIGDFTARIGDPSGRSKTRPQLSANEVEENARTYQEQVFKILDTKKTEVLFNSDWLEKLSFSDVIRLSAKCTVAQILEREDYRRRYEQGVPISLHEFLYPLAQGYDSVVVKADIEIGGTDQEFNLLFAREMQRAFGQEPQVVLTMPLLEGLDGVRKMSKSYGNAIAVMDPPEEMYAKVMSVSDALMWRYYDLASRLAPEEVNKIHEGVKCGNIHPKKAKMMLAQEITTRLHSEALAEKAEREFERVHRDHRPPEEVEAYLIAEGMVKEGRVSVVELLTRAGLVSSKSAARRMIRQGGVRWNGERVNDTEARLEIGIGGLLQVGRRKFRRVVPLTD